MLGLTNIENINTDVDIISELANTPDLSPADLKRKFDESANSLKEDINNVINELNNKLSVINNLLSAEEVNDAINNKITEIGAGDMTKAEYDADYDGAVNDSNKLDGLTLQEIMLLMNPVGTIVMNITGQNPSEYIGGTWEAWSGGRFPLGLGAPVQNSSTTFGSLTEQELNMNFTVAGATGGTYRHTLTVSQIPAHTHTVTNCPGYSEGNAWVGEAGAAEATQRVTSSTGGGAEHNNMPPYTTCYMWKRTA